MPPKYSALELPSELTSSPPKSGTCRQLRNRTAHRPVIQVTPEQKPCREKAARVSVGGSLKTRSPPARQRQGVCRTFCSEAVARCALRSSCAQTQLRDPWKAAQSPLRYQLELGLARIL